jgi:hypothetical protein
MLEVEYGDVFELVALQPDAELIANEKKSLWTSYN